MSNTYILYACLVLMGCRLHCQTCNWATHQSRRVASGQSAEIVSLVDFGVGEAHPKDWLQVMIFRALGIPCYVSCHKTVCVRVRVCVLCMCMCRHGQHCMHVSVFGWAMPAEQHGPDCTLLAVLSQAFIKGFTVVAIQRSTQLWDSHPQ